MNTAWPARHSEGDELTQSQSRLAAAAEPGSANWTTVLGVVKAGKKASTKLSQVSDCHVDLHGRFADGQSMDASGFNVCADKTLNLTD